VQLVLRDGGHEVAVDLEVSTSPVELLRRLQLRGRGGDPQREAAFQLAQDLRCRAQERGVFTHLAHELMQRVADDPP